MNSLLKPAEYMLGSEPSIEETQPAATNQDFEKRVDQLFQQFQQAVYKRTDRLFAGLLLAEWLCCVICSCLIPAGALPGLAYAKIHVWITVVLGGIVTFVPIFLTYEYSGKVFTRHTVAICQMAMSAILIYLTGGRLETHFHIFGSLAFIAFYYDWRVLVSASIFVAIDHALQGSLCPMSIYGTPVVQHWHWLEDSIWMFFQNVFLCYAIVIQTKELRLRAIKQAEVEVSRDQVEEQVKERTKELQESEDRLAGQYAVTKCLNRPGSIEGTVDVILEAIGGKLVKGAKFAALWIHKSIQEGANRYICLETWCYDVEKLEPLRQACMTATLNAENDIPAQIFRGIKARTFTDIRLLHPCLRLGAATQCGLKSAFAFPLIAEERVAGVIELFFEDGVMVESETETLLESVSRQIGQYLVRKQAEEENKRLAALVLSSADAIIALSADRTIDSWNEGAQRLYGYESAEVIGKPVSILLAPEKTDEFEELLEQIYENKRVENVENVHRHKNGSPVYVSLSLSAVNDEQGNMTGISISGRDISEKKEAEKRVSEFYSTVSHELRTPLTSIRASLGLMEGGKAGELAVKAQRLVQIARTESERLIRLINDILDLRKIEAGKLDLKVERTDADELVAATIDSIKSMAEAAGVKLKTEGDFHCELLCDRDRLTQVLTNLISNAIKFSPKDSAVLVRGEKQDHALRLSVVDAGPGIPADQITKLFGKFQQLDSSSTRSKGGTGLGLAISKALVEQHGGKIGLDTEVGKGSTFWFETPISVSN